MDSETGQPPSGQQPYPGQQPHPGQAYGARQPSPGQPYPGQQPYGGPYPFGGQMGSGRPKVRPGRIWYLAALGVLVAGVAWIVVGLFSVAHQVNSFARAPLPAGGAVTLNHSGGYVVYYEARGASSGRIPSFRVRIISASASARVGSLQPYVGSLTYTFGSHQGRAVLNLQVARPGRFLVETTGAPSVVDGSDLAFGSNITGNIVAVVLPSIGLILIGVASAVILLVIRIVRVRRARAFGM